MRKSKIIGLSLTEEALKYADEYSRSDGKSRSALISEAVVQYGAMRKLDELAEYGKKRALKIGVNPNDDADRLVHEYRADKRKNSLRRSKRS